MRSLVGSTQLLRLLSKSLAIGSEGSANVNVGKEGRVRAAPGQANNRRELQVSMLTKVTHLERLGGFRLRVRFSDGSEGVRDFAAIVNEPGPMLQPAGDEAFLPAYFLNSGGYPDGFDIAPGVLRREMAAAGAEPNGGRVLADTSPHSI